MSALLLMGFALPASACTIDTELGIAAEVNSANVSLNTSTSELFVEAMVRVRVGEFAEGERDFIVPKADVFSGDDFIIDVNLNRPNDFDGTLAPNEDTEFTIRGSVPFTGDLECGDPVNIAIRWSDMTTGEMGIAEASAGTLECLANAG